MTSLRRGEPRSKSEGRSRRKRLIEMSRILRPAPVFCPQPAPGPPASGFENGYRSDGGSGLFHHGAFLGDRKGDRTSPGLAPDGPDEAGQLPGHGGGDHRLLLSGFRQMAVPEGEAFLGLPGDSADLGRLSLVPHPDASALSGGKAVAPGGFHQDAPDVSVSGLRDPAPPDGSPTGGFRGNQTQIGHEPGSAFEPGEIPQLGHDGEGRDRVHAPESHERPDHWGKGPGLQFPADLGFDAGDASANRLDGIRILLEHDPKGRLGKGEFCDPGPESGFPFRRLRGRGLPVPKEKCGEALFQVALLGLQVFPEAGEVPHRLLFGAGDDDRRQFPRPVKPGQHERVPAIGLHPVSALLGDQGRSHHPAFVPGFEELSMQPISARPRLVDERQMGSVSSELFGHGQNGGLRVGNVPVEPHLFGFTVASGNGNRILVNVESDEFGILDHGLSSCILALDIGECESKRSQSNPRCAA